jgi:hypothetical protein
MAAGSSWRMAADLNMPHSVACAHHALPQAATAASMAEHPAHNMPQEGDGFTFEQYADRMVSPVPSQFSCGAFGFGWFVASTP